MEAPHPQDPPLNPAAQIRALAALDGIYQPLWAVGLDPSALVWTCVFSIIAAHVQGNGGVVSKQALVLFLPMMHVACGVSEGQASGHVSPWLTSSHHRGVVWGGGEKANGGGGSASWLPSFLPIPDTWECLTGRLLEKLPKSGCSALDFKRCFHPKCAEPALLIREDSPCQPRAPMSLSPPRCGETEDQRLSDESKPPPPRAQPAPCATCPVCRRPVCRCPVCCPPCVLPAPSAPQPPPHPHPPPSDLMGRADGAPVSNNETKEEIDARKSAPRLPHPHPSLPSGRVPPPRPPSVLPSLCFPGEVIKAPAFVSLWSSTSPEPHVPRPSEHS